ncbi:DUF2164 domain-containing protein [Clostridium sp. D2Q-14]|uniref:DUF2164 domain-containing protein n=1 Tax=Anaeromonas gelatinilytica TaxID=2683194 RepID=UPI00193AE09A|nr:DUF2164 domain-containing protein [Anaeromonas gelatinilytica]MBS4536356.1 DUF2164 domain-containing protein [Anaeromonas gelatinilytica]
MENKIQIDKNVKEQMINEVKDYFVKERDEDLGDLAAELILNFFIDKLGPDIYNQGVNDAHTYMSDKVEDLFALQIVKR